uniref:Uncharacterized protein n=1 Tax=Romanomermis culicivorax TaxID=13658 RepID=A0A915K9K4_ROMCU
MPNILNLFWNKRSSSPMKLSSTENNERRRETTTAGDGKMLAITSSSVVEIGLALICTMKSLIGQSIDIELNVDLLRHYQIISQNRNFHGHIQIGQSRLF